MESSHLITSTDHFFKDCIEAEAARQNVSLSPTLIFCLVCMLGKAVNPDERWRSLLPVQATQLAKTFVETTHMHSAYERLMTIQCVGEVALFLRTFFLPFAEGSARWTSCSPRFYHNIAASAFGSLPSTNPRSEFKEQLTTIEELLFRIALSFKERGTSVSEQAEAKRIRQHYGVNASLHVPEERLALVLDGGLVM